MSEPARCKLYNSVSRYGYMTITKELQTDYIGPYPSNGAVRIPTLDDLFLGKIRFVSNTTEFLNAIDEFNFPNGDGARIILAPNTYTLTTTINLEDNIVIEGETKDAIINFTGLGNVFIISGVSSVQVKNLTLNHNATNGRGLFIQNSEFIRVENCTINIVGALAETIYITGSSYCNILNCELNNLSASGSFNLAIGSSNTFIKVINNTINQSSPTISESLTTQGSEHIITGNTINGGARGPYSSNRNTLITNNKINDASIAGIIVQQSGCLVSNNIISNSANGIEILNGGDVLCSKNIFIGSGSETGIHLQVNAQGNLFTSNNLQNLNVGISVDNSAGIVDNFFTKNNIKATTAIVNNLATPLELVNNVNQQRITIDGTLNPFNIDKDVEELIIEDVTTAGVVNYEPTRPIWC